MKTIKKLQILTLALMLSLFAFCGFGGSVFAKELDDIAAPTDDVQPLAIATLSIEIATNSGYVLATAKTTFSLFFPTVKIYVQLYSSLTLKQTYNDMTLEGQNYTDDLDIGKSIQTRAPINGVKRYWQARIYYKIDSSGWTEKVTHIWLIDVDGTGTVCSLDVAI